jgi:L-lactate dehydrogenase complex protein LldG
MVEKTRRRAVKPEKHSINPIIANIRDALDRTNGTPGPERLPVLSPRTPGTVDEEIDLLVAEINALSGVAQRLRQVEIPEAIGKLVSDQEINRAVIWKTAGLKELQIELNLREAGVEIIPPDADHQALAKCDLGVTEADFALPETGTLALFSSDEKPRAVSLLPRVHLAIISPQCLRADLHQVFAEARREHYMVFITGPSRTSDIELTVTLGVHGPKNLYVWILH